MITLFCDLDNTIVYSHRRTLNSAKRVAEMLNGAPQSYMTEKTFSFLSTCQMISIIPVTTRTIRQYKRLENTLKDLNCKYSLVLNGAILIRDGEIDEDWLDESKKLVHGYEDELTKAAELMEKCEAHVKYRDEFLVYSSVSNPKFVVEKIKKEIDTSQIYTFCDSRKVYCTPSVITKGSATKRLTSLLQSGFTIGVGDSINDVSMLKCVDIPIIPQVLEPFIDNPERIVISKKTILSDAACDAIENLISYRNL